MDIFIFILGLFVTIIGAVFCLGTWLMPFPYERFRDHPSKFLMIGTLVAGVLLIAWVMTALVSQANSEPNSVVFLEIENRNGANFFISPSGNPKIIVGDYTYADPSKYQIEFKTFKSSWRYGIYVTGTVDWSVVPKAHKIESP